MTTTGRAKRAVEDGFEYSVATAPSTARHRQLASAVVIAALVAYAAMIPYANIALPRIDSFIPFMFAVVFVADLVTAVLLYAQFFATGSRPLLVLASGYLFSSLIIVVHTAIFQASVFPAGLLVVGPQSVAWINVSWRIGLAASIAGYAVMRSRRRTNDAIVSAPRFAISWSVAAVVIVVCALTGAVTAGHDFFPRLMLDGEILPLGVHVNNVVVLANLLALLLLLVSTRGRSILDLWLIVVAVAMLAESLMISAFAVARFTLAFYAIRLIALPVSKVVLVALLWETMRLYANLAISNRELRRERADRLTNTAEAMAAISHEVRQPLTGINLQAYAGEKFLDRTPPDVGMARKLFGEIKEAAFRANEVFDGFLRLFREGRQDLRAVDINALTVQATVLLRKGLDDHKVTITTNLASDLPVVQGHTGQLREVILNLIQNSIDVLATTTDRPRVITIATSRLGAGAVSISLQDTGPGMGPEQLASIFDAFVTTKARGTGLGLAICKMIVDQHGGTLSASSGETGGARFEVTLPTGTAAPAVPATPTKQSDPLQAIR